MAVKSISQKESEINCQFSILDDLLDNIDEIQALTEIGINCNFDHVSADSIRNYCYLLLSLAKSARDSANNLLAVFRQKYDSVI